MNRQQLVEQALAALLANGYDDATSEGLFTTHKEQFLAYLRQLGAVLGDLVREATT